MGGGWSVTTKIMQIKKTHKKIPQVDSLLTDMYDLVNNCGFTYQVRLCSATFLILFNNFAKYFKAV